MNIFEILLLLAVALIVVGPERLPEVLHMVGKVLRELRLASNTVLRELTEVTEEPRRTLPATAEILAQTGDRSAAAEPSSADSCCRSARE